MSCLEFTFRRYFRLVDFVCGRVIPREQLPRIAEQMDDRSPDATWDTNVHELFCAMTPQTEHLQRGLQILEQDLVYFRDFAEESGSKFGVIQIPTYFTLDPDWFFENECPEGRLLDDYDPDFWQTWFDQRFPQTPFYDPASTLRVSGHKYWFQPNGLRGDIHPDAKGHGMIASVVSAKLEVQLVSFVDYEPLEAVGK